MTAVNRSAAWEPKVGCLAHDVVKDCDVRVVVRPGVYATDKWWVRPLERDTVGWLASGDELQAGFRRPTVTRRDRCFVMFPTVVRRCR